MTSAPNAPESARRYVRVRDVAAACEVHTRTVWAWVKAGRFPAPIRWTPGGNFFWPADVLTEFLEARRGQGGKEVKANGRRKL
jgi:predicted DNA-binding transcriptional regulator AlpA